MPEEPEAAVWVSFKLPSAKTDAESSILDQYSDKVLRVDNPSQASLGDRILNSFTPLHYSTFWGLPTHSLRFCGSRSLARQSKLTN